MRAGVAFVGAGAGPDVLFCAGVDTINIGEFIPSSGVPVIILTFKLLS